MTSTSSKYQLEINKKVQVKVGKSTGSALVLEKGPKSVYKVTYDGWSSIYDEYVIPENCKNAESGEQITTDTKVNNGDKLKVAWLDGSSYVGTVLAKETAVACIRPDAYPKGYRIWITANDLVGDYELDGQAISNDDSKAIEVGSQISVKLMNGLVVKANVIKKGPVPVVFVTYNGWSKVFDEYVEISQCTDAKTGSDIADISEVTINSKLKVKWLDGGCYEGIVLGTSTALARVNPTGYPKEYTLWVTEKEIVSENGAKSSNEQTGDILQDALQSAMKDAMQHINGYQQESLEIKRKDETPRRKIPPSLTHDKKDNPKWKKMISRTLISEVAVNKLKTKASEMKRCTFVGKPMAANENHVAICASKDDLEFAEMVGNALTKRGLKVTTNQDDLHNSRTFLLIYSDSVNMDENTIRHLTRAAERYNMGETIIVALVRPGCPEEVIDHIPDRVAYSLSNVVFFNFDLFGESAENGRRQTISDLVSLIRSNSDDSRDYDVTGTWLCQAVVTSSVTSYSTSRDFTLLLKQQGTKITGRTVDNFKVEGDVQKNILRLRLSYRGEYAQNLESWEEKDYFFLAEIAAIITNQGYRLEGEYVEETDCGTESKNLALKYNRFLGPFSATLEKQCLSGYYNAHWYRTPEYNETFAIVHRGGKEIIAQFPYEFGSTTVGFLDLSSSTLQLNSCSNRNMTRTLIGKFTRDCDGASAFQCLSYGCESGLAGMPESIALTRDPIHIIKPVSEDDDGLLEEMHNSIAERLQGIPFTPGSYSPLQSDEFPVVVFCTEHEKEKAEMLKKELEDVQEIAPVSIKSSDWKKSRTIVLLLSKFTQTDKDLIEAIEEAAEQELPIFNIGLDSWFSIFGPDNWRDQDLRLKLMNALARLNQTPDTTLDPNHQNFRGLVKGIRKKIEPPRFALVGLFGVEVVGSNPPEKITKYSDLEDETIQMIKRPLMMYLYLEPSSTRLQMGTDFIVQGLTGEIDPETFTLTMSNDAGSYILRMNADMDKLYGKYWSNRANKEYTILVTKAETGISGFYVMGGQQTPTGIVQLGKKTADVMFGGYTLPAVISNGKLVFNAPCPGQKDILITYAAQILLKPDGNYLYGFSYQSKSTTPRNAFDAKQYAGSTLKVSKGKKAKNETAEGWLLTMIEEFWRSMDVGDYEAVLKISTGDMITKLPKEVFDKLVIEHKRTLGKYTPKSAIYIGKKAQVTMGKSVGATKYDFTFDFDKCKKVYYSIMIMDIDRSLNGIQSYEEEAELTDSSQYDVMISYRSWDARWVDLLQSFLEQNGYSVWRDRRMDVGVNWSEDITKAVRKSGCVVAAISQNYLTSVLCTKEVRMAHDISKPVIPLVLPETCPKTNPIEKLVSSSYEDSHLPITIANEISDITWIDFRPLANLNTPDPSDVKSFENKYRDCLESLVRILEELSNHRRVVDLQGDWNVVIGNGNEEENSKLSILATAGAEIEGVMTSYKYANADIPLDKNVSICHGSNIHIVGHHKGKGIAVTYTIDAKVAADANSFAGVCRIHKTPWEHPVGQEVNALVVGFSHYTTTNDCAAYPVKGVRDKPLRGIESNQNRKEEFVLDMKRAYGIVKDAFSGVKKEALEMSIISYKEAFDKYDTDGSHELDMNELELALRVANMNCSHEEKQSIMKELDQDDNGTVDFYEFLEYIAKIKQSKVKQNTAAAQVVKKGFISKVCSIQ